MSERRERRSGGRTARSRGQRRSCSCMRSSGTTGRATRRWKSSRAPSLRSGRASRWRWSRPRAPASRRCCTSPACSSIPTPARSMSTGRRPRTLSDAERTRIRRTEIGFVYQFHHLLPEFSALENVMLPQMIRGLSRKEATQARGRAAELSRAERAADAPAGGTFRRRAAARRDRARGRQCAAHPAGRRADRQSRSAHRRARVRRAARSWCARRASPPSSPPTTWILPPAWTAASPCSDGQVVEVCD